MLGQHTYMFAPKKRNPGSAFLIKTHRRNFCKSGQVQNERIMKPITFRIAFENSRNR